MHDLNKVLHTIFYFIIILLFTSCEEESGEIMEPEIPIIVDSEVLPFELYDIDGSLTPIPIAYFGDTIKFKVNFKSNTLIRYVSFHYTKGFGDKIETLLGGSHKLLNAMEGSFEYIYPVTTKYNHQENLLKEERTPVDFKFIIDYHDSLTVVKSDTLRWIRFLRLSENNHQRLYNIAENSGINPRGYYYSNNNFQYKTFGRSPHCGGGFCRLASDPMFLMTNIPNADYVYEKDSSITKDFIEGWHSPQKNHFFVKIEKK